MGSFILAMLCFIVLCPDSSWAQVIELEGWGEFEKSGSEGWSVFSGYLALLLFIIGNLYTPAKWVIKHRVSRDAQILKNNLKKLFKIHVQCNIWMFIFALIHMFTVSQGNIFLVLAMLVLAWLIVGGHLMQSKISMHKDFRKYMKILHAQQVLFGLVIVLLLIGHASLG